MSRHEGAEMSHEEFLLRDGRSIVNFLGQGVSDCGYCKNESGGRKSNNMIAFKLTANDYQALLDRGWRRSGTLCYLPRNHEACCPNYPILCKTLEFKLGRSKKKCIDNLNRYLITGIFPGQRESQNDAKIKLNYNKYADLETEPLQVVQESFEPYQASRFTKRTFDELKSSKKAKDKRFVKSCERKVKLHNLTIDEALRKTRDRPHKIAPSLEHYLYPHKTFLQLPRDVAGDHLHTLKPKHQLEIRLLQVESRKSRALREEQHEILMKYQEKVHKESRSKWDMSRFCDFLVDTPLFVEPLEEQYDYLGQTEGEADDTFSKKSYNSEFDYLLVRPPNLPTAYGTYHCTYHLDDKMIACGVLDVLPECITTVYFFYDPKYAKLNLGYYSALVEISMIRQMAKRFTGEQKKLVNYHIGYYVHECLKMHYKARFRPSYLLCSETAEYVPTEECLKKLAKEAKKYVRFSAPNVPNAYNFDPTTDDILKIPISVDVFKNKSLKLSDYFEWLEKNIGKEYIQAIVYNYLTPYARSVGRNLLGNIILQIDRVHRGLLSRYLIATEEQARKGKE